MAEAYNPEAYNSVILQGFLGGPIKTYFRLQRGHSNVKSCRISVHFVYLDVLCQKRQGVAIGYEVFIVWLTNVNYLIIKSTGCRDRS